MIEWYLRHWEYDSGDRIGKQKQPVDILIGCPIQKREWIFDLWHWHVMRACKRAGLRPGFIFVLDPTEEPLNTMIHNACEINGVDLWTCEIEEVQREDKRDWHQIRFERMVELRNVLLAGVRSVQPPLFLSLDSDILLNVDALLSMVEKITDADAAIGGKTYMTHTGTTYPSYGIFTNGEKYRRQDSEGCFPVDVLMAIKLMKPAAYSIDYRYSEQGEDIGWSMACKKAGLKFRWDGAFVNKHVMKPDQLERVDARAGY